MRGLRARIDRLPFVAALVAGTALAPGPAAAEDVTPLVTPDRIEDVPSTRPDPFPAFSNFAWRAFVALSWPAMTGSAHRGEPDRAKSLRDPGPRVWETFKSRFEVFQPGAAGHPSPPAAWDSYLGRNPCGAGADNRKKSLASFEPFADFNQPTFTYGEFGNPLVARNRTYVRYEVRMNKAEFDSIVENGSSGKPPTAETPAAFEIGSIAVKAAWRILGESDTARVRERYYVVEDAEVVDVPATLAAGETVCGLRDVALVGLHIAIKTRYRPQWIWSTFEHVDNVPPIGIGDAREPDAKDAGAPYSFNDPALPQDEVAPPRNSPLAWAVGAANPPRDNPDPMQVVRKHRIHPEIMAMNRAYWSLPEIKGTAWAHYMLVATQWPTVTVPEGPDNDGRYFPGLRIEKGTPAEPYQTDDEPDLNLVNVTMETYAQDPPSSCMACHHAVSNVRGRDFVGILPEAN